MRRVSVLVSVLALLAPVLLLLGGSPARARALRTTASCRPRCSARSPVGMPNERTVKVQHSTPRPRHWDAPTTLYRTAGGSPAVTIDGRLLPPGRRRAAGRVRHAVLRGPGAGAQRRPGLPRRPHLEPDQAARRGLPAPAISPSGSYAAWLAGGTGEYVEWSATSGLRNPRGRRYGYDGGGETPVVDDAGTVTVIGPEPTSRRRGLRDRHPHPRPGRRQVAHRSSRASTRAAPRAALENVDALTVLGGGFERATQFTLARAAVGAPWTRHQGGAGRRARAGRVRLLAQADHDVLPLLLDAGRPLVAIGSPDRHQDPDPGLRRGDPDLGSADPDLRVSAAAAWTRPSTSRPPRRCTSPSSGAAGPKSCWSARTRSPGRSVPSGRPDSSAL